MGPSVGVVAEPDTVPMKTIHRFALKIADEQTIEIPQYFGPMSLQAQFYPAYPDVLVPCIWALVDTDQPKVRLRVRIIETNQPLPDDIEMDFNYIGTVLMGAIAKHVFLEET